jgi:ATP phosphoribosyltransferase
MSALRLAIPSKGRLKEQTEAFFEDAGLRISAVGGARGYAAKIDGVAGVDVRLLSAGEISAAVLAGEVHVGVTGEDQLREMSPDLDRAAHLLSPLGFGHADLVVAAPKSWIDVDTMADVDDVAARMEARSGRRLRVATKYVRSTRRFFQSMGVGHYQIVESAGATEGAPAAGSAELVVDITTTGATLEGNGLKILSDGLILKSQAQLAVSFGAAWDDEALAALKGLSDIVEARRAGKGMRALRFAADADLQAIVARFGSAFELVAPGEAFCARGQAHDVARAIAILTKGPVGTSDADFLFRAENRRFAAFIAALQAGRAA